MESFTYYTPTKVYFGTDALDNLGSDLKKRGATKVLIHYGSERIVESGLMSKVEDELCSVGIGSVKLGGVVPNPHITLCRKGVELCKQEGVDFLLAVGGGSVIDSTKAIRLALALDMDPWDAVVSGMMPDKPFPMGCVLTMAAAGSEMSNSAVLTNPDGNLKRGCNGDGNRPDVAFMDPSLTVTTPAYQTAAGIVDIMMHSMERFLSDYAPTPITDNICLAILKTVKERGAELMKDLDNLDLRADIMWASSLSHNNLTELGRGKTFTAHKIEHDISGYLDVTHGAGLAVVFPAWCLYEAEIGTDRFYELMHNLWDAPLANDEKSRLASISEGVANMRKYFKSIGMPTTMSELGVSPDMYEDISNLTTGNGEKEIPSYRGKLGKQDIIEIYKLAEAN